MEKAALSLLPCELPLTQEGIDTAGFHFQGSPRRGSFRGHEIEEHVLPLPEGCTAALSCRGGTEIPLDCISIFVEPGRPAGLDLQTTERGFEALAALGGQD